MIAKDGGAKRILACGQPVTELGFQSALAWEIGLNVENVGFNPSTSITTGDPIVLFEPRLFGWELRPIHTPAADRTKCDRLKTNTAFG